MSLCKRCGVEVRSNFCPDCGEPISKEKKRKNVIKKRVIVQKKYSTLGIVSFFLGILSMTVLIFLPLMGLITIFISKMALKEIDNDPRLKGREFATFGMFLGFLKIILPLIVIGLILAFMLIA